MFNPMEQACTPTHLRLRGLGWRDPALPGGPKADRHAGIHHRPVAVLSPPGPSPSVQQPFPLYLGHAASRKPGCLQSPQPWAPLVPEVTKLTLLSCLTVSFAPLPQVCAQIPQGGVALPGCPGRSVPWVGHGPCSVGTLRKMSSSAGDTASEARCCGDWLLHGEAQGCR